MRKRTHRLALVGTAGQFRAFTLLEMLLVVFILGMVASSVVIFVGERDEQARYDATKRRYEQIKEAIFGPEGLSLNGAPLLRGYMADTGELPTDLRHLWDCPPGLRSDPHNPASAPIPFQRVGGGTSALLNQIQIYYGWRGPYLSFTSSTADADFLDGWGHPWVFATAPTGVTIQSLGRNGEPGDGAGDSFSADFPPTTAMAEFAPTAYDPQDAGIPGIRVVRSGAATGTGLLTLGLVYAGFDMSVGFSVNDRSIVKKGGVEVKVGFPDTANDGDLEDTNSSSPTDPLAPGDSLPAGLSFQGEFSASPRTRFPRQYQLVLYDESKSGTSFADKLVSVYPIVFTLLPKTSFVAPATPPWRVD